MALLNARRFVSALACLYVTTGATRYLSPDGTDSGAATTEATAWATLAYALSNSSALASGDTLIVMNGEWTGDNAPYKLSVHSSKAGTDGDWTYIIADTAATPIFDWTGNTGWTSATATYGIFWDQFSPFTSIEGITFQDYPDSLSGASSIGSVYGGTVRVKAALGNDLYGFHVINCVFEAEDQDSVDCAVAYFANSAIGSAEVLHEFAVRGNVIRGAMNSAIAFGPTDGAIIEGNHIEGHIANQHRSVDGPNGIQMLKYGHNDTYIRDNTIKYYDHGAELHGLRGTFERNVISDLSDDFIWLHDGSNAATMGRRATRDWIVRDNLFMWGEDEGIDLGGAGHHVYHNTILRCGDWMININEDTGSPCSGSCDPDSNLVEANVFVISADGADGGGGLNAVQLSSGHSGNIIRNNLFFDPTGTLEFDDDDDVGVTGLSTFNAKSYASGNVETAPGLIDTTVAASKPFAAGYVPIPTPSSTLLGFGMQGRTAGSEPCYGCPAFQLNVTGFEADSVHIYWRHPNGTPGGWRQDRAVRELVEGQSWIADIDPTRVVTSGKARALWAIFRNGVAADSIGAVDEIDVTTPGYYAAVVEDTLAAELTALQTTADTIDGNTTSIGADLESDLAVDLSAVAAGVSALPSAAAIADAVLDEPMAGHTTEGTAGENIAYNSVVYSQTANIGLDLESDLGVDLSAMAAAISALPSAAATASAVDDTLSATHGAAAWTDAGVTLGNGSNDVAIFVKASADSSAISGARISVWSTDYATRHFKTTTGSDGAIDAALDAGTYAWTASDPGVYAPGSGTFTVSTDPDTATVYLAGIALSAAADPDYCTMYVDVADWFGTEVDNIEVKVRFDGQLGYGGGLLMAGAIMDTTGTPTTGRATLTIPRSSAMTSPDGVSTFTFTFTDLLRTTTRRANPYPSFTISGVSVPDSTSANLRYNTPGVD